MSGNRIIVIGASAGGVEALKELVKGLPANIPAPILIVLHIPSYGGSALPLILSRVGGLKAIHPTHHQKLEKRMIYVAPPDEHLLVKRDHVILSRGPTENGHRPAIDPLFRTAARSYGPRVIGVVLSGGLDDGTAGLAAIKEKGGITIVQDPEEAIYSGMPQNAIDHVEVDYILKLAEISALLAELAREHVEDNSPETEDQDLNYESDMAQLKMSTIEDQDRPGKPSTFICPECGGSLWEISDGGVLRYRCHVGHAYTAETFMSEQSDAVERALWVALRALEDNAALSQRLLKQSLSQGRQKAAEKFEKQAQIVEEHAKIIRDVLVKGVLNETAEADKDEL